MAKRRRNWDWPRISGWFALLFAPARADARFARTKGDYVRMLLQCLLGIPVSMSPAFVALFTFCFALALDVLWEIYEFTVDALFQTNMQKYALEGGEALTGQAALQDTMGGPDRGFHRGAGHRHRGLPLPHAREGEQEHKAGAPQEEGAGKLPAPSSCFALSAPASCARAPR